MRSHITEDFKMSNHLYTNSGFRKSSGLYQTYHLFNNTVNFFAMLKILNSGFLIPTFIRW